MLRGVQSLSEHFGEEINRFPLPGSEPRTFQPYSSNSLGVPWCWSGCVCFSTLQHSHDSPNWNVSWFYSVTRGTFHVDASDYRLTLPYPSSLVANELIIINDPDK